MKQFFTRNLDKKGRMVRGVGALAMLAGSGFGFTVSMWLGVALLALGAFMAFEALCGWCIIRACGIKTML